MLKETNRPRLHTVGTRRQRTEEISAEQTGNQPDFFLFFQLLLAYHVPMLVKDALVLCSWSAENIFYHCPRCQQILEREFVAHCSQCGQSLDWSEYENAKITYRNTKK